MSPSRKDSVLSVEQVIMGGGDFVATNSLMYRACLIKDKIPEFYEYLSLDYSLQIYGSLRGGMLYLHDCMSSYRWLAKGSWTSRQRADPLARKRTQERIVRMLEILDRETNYQYSGVIQCRTLLEQEKYREALLKSHRKELRHFNWKNRIKLRLKVAFPILLCLKEKICK